MFSFIHKCIAMAILTLGVNGQLLASVKLGINFASEHQTIDGFGASDAWSINPLINKWSAAGQEQDIENLADVLFSKESGIGLSAWRFNIGAGSYEQGANSLINLDVLGKEYRRVELLQKSAGSAIDETKQRGQIRFLQEAYERDVEHFIAFSNSPPVWATKNGLAHPNDGIGVGSTNLDPAKTVQFVTFLVDVMQYLRGGSVGVPVNYISPINEPTWEWQGKTQEGNRYNLEDAIDVYEQLYEALENAGLENEIEIDAGEVVEYTAALSDANYKSFTNSNSSYSGGMNGTGNGLYRNYINELLGSRVLRDKIGNKISLHGYFSDIWLDRMGQLRDELLENVKAVSPNAKIWMSEFSILGGTGDARNFDGNGWNVNDMDYALHVAKVLHRDLTRLNVSAWHWWLGVTPYNYKDGLIKVNQELEASSVQTSKILWTLGQYSRFIRPGYKRVSVGNIDALDSLMASAYKSPEQNKLVVVVTNTSDSEQTVEIDLEGLPQGKSIDRFKAYVTNANNDLTPADISSPFDMVTIPSKSIMTLEGIIVDDSSAPNVDFSFDIDVIEANGYVSFQSHVSHSPDSLSWSFPGGSPESSTALNPTVQYAEPGIYDVTLSASNQYGNDVKTTKEAINVVAENTYSCESEGSLTVEKWVSLPDTGDYDYDSSVASIPLQEDADLVESISSFEIATDTGDHYATRIRGYICVPESGHYTFWIASDNQGELWLSSDDNPENVELIAHSLDWNNFREWDKYETQKSDLIYLLAGKQYFVETLHKEFNGGDNLSIGWQLPNGMMERPIVQNRISSYPKSSDGDLETPNQPPPSSGGSMSFLEWTLLLFGTRKLVFKVKLK